MQVARAIAVAASFACAGGACAAEVGDEVAIARVARGDDLDTIRRAAAAQLYAQADDDFDMVVLWDTRGLGGARFSYLPVANDVEGIGEPLYDRAPEYGSARLEGFVWMGEQWRELSAEDGRYSVFGLLAQETAHRWGAMVRAAGADVLASDGVHWSALADLGDSPIGGNRWRALGDRRFAAETRTEVGFSDADLYLMGVLAAEDVAPIPLLTEVRAGTCAMPHPCAEAWRDVAPAEVEATLSHVPIADIIAVEGARTPAREAAPLRQAWALVVYDDDEPRAADLDRLRELRAAWPAYWARATRELASIDIGP